MKSSLLVCLITLLCLTNIFGQKDELTKGDIEFSAGLGLVPTYVADQANSIVPPLSARIDYHISDNLSLGAFAAYSKSESDQINRPNGVATIYTSEVLLTGVRATINTNRFKNWNIYGGLALGYSIPTVESQSFYIDPENTRDDMPADDLFARSATNQFIYSGYIGATRYLNNQVGIYGEIGYGVSLLNVGLTVRL